MKLTLIVDLDNGRVILKRGSRSLLSETEERWLQLFARMALAQRRGESWVTADALSELQHWARLKKDNVGKIVAKYVDRHSDLRFFLDTNKKTVRWKLRSDIELRVIQDDVSLRNWLRDRGLARAPLPVSTPWLQQIVRAQIAFHRGEIEAASALALAARRSATDDRSLRISALQLLRAEDARGRFREGRNEVEAFLAQRRAVTNMLPESIWGSDALGLHCRARVAVMDAMRGHGADREEHVRALRTALKSADDGADIARQTMLSNALGILAWRRGDFDDARAFLDEAISLALAINDLFTLGGAIFNLALTDLVAQKTTKGRVRPEFAQDLLTLCSELDAKVVVGRSSAQAEILNARLHVGAARFAEAERLVATAEDMVRRTGSPYDRGGLMVAQAELVWARVLKGGIDRDAGTRAAIKFLTTAAQEFAKTQSEGASYAESQLQRLREGRGVESAWPAE